MVASRKSSLVLAAWFIATTTGLPLPVPSPAARVAGERYPCEDCPCGCGSADHCWTACCCHTLGERLAWARREGVRPPETALAQARRDGLEIEAWVATRTVALAAAAKRSKTPPPRPRCSHCASTPAAPINDTTDRNASSADRPAPGVSVLAALACRGMKGKWLALGPFTLVNPVVVAIELPAGAVAPAVILPGLDPVLSVPTPPPRALA